MVYVAMDHLLLLLLRRRVGVGHGRPMIFLVFWSAWSAQRRVANKKDSRKKLKKGTILSLTTDRKGTILSRKGTILSLTKARKGTILSTKSATLRVGDDLATPQILTRTIGELLLHYFLQIYPCESVIVLFPPDLSMLSFFFASFVLVTS